MKSEFLYRIFSSIILIPSVIFIVIKGSTFFNIFLIICFLISAYEWIKMIKNIPSVFIGILFLILSFFSIYKIRFNLDQDFMLLLIILIICISTDLGGYVFGKLIKGPKLTKISPNKTYSGMFGSFIFTGVFVYLFLNNPFLEYYYDISFKTVIFTILVSSVCQLGDLTISYFKRISGVKDTGKIIPGHGGLLDRIDGMVFAFPFSYLYILFIGTDLIK